MISTVHRPRWQVALIVHLATGWLGGCAGSSQGPRSCTTVFTFISLTVLNQNGSPATDVIVLDTVLQTAVGFPVPQDSSLLNTGVYDVFDDNYKSLIRQSGDSVRVTGIRNPKRFSTTFFVDSPDGCHVHKVSGPDSVTLQ